MNQDKPTWQQNRVLMGELWPRWRLEPALSRLLDEKWGSLHQDKLRECIRQHRLERDASPDLSSIHSAYCRITGHGDAGKTAVRETRNYVEQMRGPSEAELEAWDRDAKHILATTNAEEINAAKQHFGISPVSDRVLSMMIQMFRDRQPHRQAT